MLHVLGLFTLTLCPQHGDLRHHAGSGWGSRSRSSAPPCSSGRRFSARSWEGTAPLAHSSGGKLLSLPGYVLSSLITSPLLLRSPAVPVFRYSSPAYRDVAQGAAYGVRVLHPCASCLASRLPLLAHLTSHVSGTAMPNDIDYRRSSLLLCLTSLLHLASRVLLFLSDVERF